MRPLFIDSPSGRIFGVYFPPAASVSKDVSVLYVPPFAEEMNRSRRMAALQARAFAGLGCGTLLLDLFGTGDSAGDFRDGSVAHWLDDIAAAAAWLRAQGGASLALWGLRFGGLLAAAAATRLSDVKYLLLWQPVTDGKAMLTQFLRIRVAASMSGGAKGETTSELRARLSAGSSIEVAGYEIAPRLAEALDGLRLADCRLAPGTHVDWLEVSEQASAEILPAGRRVVAKWREENATVATSSVVGDPFWAVQETTVVTGLVTASAEALGVRLS